MKRIFTFALIAGALTSCNGPAFPERDGRLSLEKRGYPESIIVAVAERKPLDPRLVVELRRKGNEQVRFLIASNPHLSPEAIDLFIEDKNDFARSGTAHNPALTRSQMEKLFHDPSHTVYCGLAGNPSVPEALLLKLHAERNPGLLWFALNPKCPPAIKSEIRKSNDELARYWLQMTEDRVKSPHQIRESTSALREGLPPGSTKRNKILSQGFSQKA